MAEEFQGEVCGGGSWWINSPRTNFMMNNFVYGSGGCWQNDFMMNNMKTIRSSTINESSSTTAKLSPDSTFQMMVDSSPPSSTTTTNWNNNNNQALLVNGRNEESTYNNQTLPEILTSLSAGNQNSSNNNNFVMDDEQQQTSNFTTSNNDCTSNLVSATSYGGYPPSLLQTLFDNTTPPPEQAEQPPLYEFHDQNLNDYNPVSIMSGFPSILKPKQQQGLHLANNNKTPFWDSNNNISQAADFYTSAQSAARYLSLTNDEKPNCLSTQVNEEVTNMLKKSVGEATYKRPRLETPSPLPTFKVRKEKLGDRVTALQQLVSPFGKTDTASVLHEAIEYIKLLHDQVNILSAPYMKNGATTQRQQIQDKIKNNVKEGAKQQDLRSRGLCLVPVSSTFPVATGTAPEYWTSSGFGSTTTFK
uniref:transcription factor bHLH112-like isoform X2 n=1 Tax=Erigeron canadensis TaxID=72917 RepID=UPI001CB909AB|nr:transcription factor bHLH112-like isoform X2 [Erigeron canadensis]